MKKKRRRDRTPNAAESTSMSNCNNTPVDASNFDAQTTSTDGFFVQIPLKVEAILDDLGRTPRRLYVALLDRYATERARREYWSNAAQLSRAIGRIYGSEPEIKAGVEKGRLNQDAIFKRFQRKIFGPVYYA